MLSLFREQPKAFSMIFMLEIWERFGFYTAQGILTLYFIRYLGFDDAKAYFTFGAFSALVYGLVAVGGFLGDNVLGTKRLIVLGLITLAAGYLLLALATPHTVYRALGFIAVGNGLFKANPSSLLAKCYKTNDARLHGGFTLYYMAINLGSVAALFAGPYLASHYGYAYAYFLSFIGLVLGLVNYGFQRRLIANIHTKADEKAISFAQWAWVVVGIVVVSWVCAQLLQHVVLTQWLLLGMCALIMGMYFYAMRGQTARVKRRMAVAFILMLEAVVFFTLYQQMPTSLNVFAVNNVTPSLMGLHVDPQTFQVLNPIWIISLSPFLAMAYRSLHAKGIALHVPYKFAMGMLCCGVGFSLLYFARFAHNDAGMVSSGWLVASYFFQSTGELLVSALGVAMVAELVPASMSGFVMGMWFLTTSVAGFLGAFVASLTALPAHIEPGISSLHIYTTVFAQIGLVTLMLGAIMWLISARLTRIMLHEAKPSPHHLMFLEHTP